MTFITAHDVEIYRNLFEEIREILIRQQDLSFLPGVNLAIETLTPPADPEQARDILRTIYAGAGSLSNFYATRGGPDLSKADNARFEEAISRLWTGLDC